MSIPLIINLFFFATLLESYYEYLNKYNLKNKDLVAFINVNNVHVDGNRSVQSFSY